MSEKYEIWDPKFGIDDFVKKEFTTGLCYQLAQQISILTGWVIYAEVLKDSKGNENFEHFWVVNNDFFAVDINGVHKSNFAETIYSKKRSRGEAREVSALDEFTASSGWAKEVVHHFPEYFGIKKEVVMKNSKSYLNILNGINMLSKNKIHPEIIGQLRSEMEFIEDEEIERKTNFILADFFN